MIRCVYTSAHWSRYMRTVYLHRSRHVYLLATLQRHSKCGHGPERLLGSCVRVMGIGRTDLPPCVGLRLGECGEAHPECSNPSRGHDTRTCASSPLFHVLFHRQTPSTMMLSKLAPRHVGPLLARAYATQLRGRTEILTKHPDDVVITFAKRTALGRAKKGQLKDVPVDELLHALFKVRAR